MTVVAWPAQRAVAPALARARRTSRPSGPAWACGIPGRFASSSSPTGDARLAHRRPRPDVGRGHRAARALAPSSSAPTQDDLSAPCGTSWPTSRSTRRCRCACRSGSTRATPPGPQASGSGLGPRAQPRRRARCDPDLTSSTGRCAARLPPRTRPTPWRFRPSPSWRAETRRARSRPCSAARRGEDFETAVLATTGLTLGRFEEEWQPGPPTAVHPGQWLIAGGGWAWSPSWCSVLVRPPAPCRSGPPGRAGRRLGRGARRSELGPELDPPPEP